MNIWAGISSPNPDTGIRQGLRFINMAATGN